jgi:hypothetical protein
MHAHLPAVTSLFFTEAAVLASEPVRHERYNCFALFQPADRSMAGGTLLQPTTAVVELLVVIMRCVESSGAQDFAEVVNRSKHK